MKVWRQGAKTEPNTELWSLAFQAGAHDNSNQGNFSTPGDFEINEAAKDIVFPVGLGMSDLEFWVLLKPCNDS